MELRIVIVLEHWKCWVLFADLQDFVKDTIHHSDYQTYDLAVFVWLYARCGLYVFQVAV